MRILVLGAAGRVGQKTIELGAAAGHSMYALARNSSKIKVSGERIFPLQGDALNLPSLEAAFTSATPDVVISTLGHVSGCPKDLVEQTVKSCLSL